jgi:tetrathionate reductase subunit B
MEAENALVRMHQDLQRALKKPAERRSWAMAVDVRKCIGCYGCTVACIAENVLPPGVMYRTVLDIELGKYPNVVRILKPMNCQQCDNAPCVPAANAVAPGSLEKRPDGVVAVNYERATKEAFEAARAACPYKRAVYFDDGRFYTDGTPAPPGLRDATKLRVRQGVDAHSGKAPGQCPAQVPLLRA